MQESCVWGRRGEGGLSASFALLPPLPHPHPLTLQPCLMYSLWCSCGNSSLKVVLPLSLPPTLYSPRWRSPFCFALFFRPFSSLLNLCALRCPIAGMWQLCSLLPRFIVPGQPLLAVPPPSFVPLLLFLSHSLSLSLLPLCPSSSSGAVVGAGIHHLPRLPAPVTCMQAGIPPPSSLSSSPQFRLWCSLFLLPLSFPCLSLARLGYPR